MTWIILAMSARWRDGALGLVGAVTFVTLPAHAARRGLHRPADPGYSEGDAPQADSGHRRRDDHRRARPDAVVNLWPSWCGCASRDTSIGRGASLERLADRSAACGPSGRRRPPRCRLPDGARTRAPVARCFVLLRRLPRGARHHARHRQPRDHGADRPVRLRQDNALAHATE